MNKEIKEDLEYFLKQAEVSHLDFYFVHTKKELNEFINKYLDDYKVNDKYDLIYMLRCIIKYMSGVYDAHTGVNDDSLWFPLNLKVVENEIYIDSCYNVEFEKTKLLAINNIPISDIVKEMEKSISYGTNGWLKRNLEIELTNSTSLKTLPSINSNTTKFEFLTDKGVLEIDTKKEYPKREKGPNYIIINNTLIYRYKMCNKANQPNVDEIDKIIKENNINTFALDIRNNSGGNSTLIYPLLEYLKNSNLNVYTIVNKGVFSATRFASIDMRRIGSKIIGEDKDIGTPINCFGNIFDGGATPNYGVKMRFSKKYFYLNEDTYEMEQITDKEELNSKPKEFFIPKYLELDEYIPLSKEDYLNGIDPIHVYFEQLGKNFKL